LATAVGELKVKNDPDPDDDADGDDNDCPFDMEVDFGRIFKELVEGSEDEGDEGLPKLAFSARSRSIVSLFAFSRTGRFLNTNDPKSISFGGSLDRRSRRRDCSLTCGGIDNGKRLPRFKNATSVFARSKLIGSLSIISGVCPELEWSSEVSSSGKTDNVPVNPRESK
jgi:hypothetical protein